MSRLNFNLLSVCLVLDTRRDHPELLDSRTRTVKPCVIKLVPDQPVLDEQSDQGSFCLFTSADHNYIDNSSMSTTL